MAEGVPTRLSAQSAGVTGGSTSRNRGRRFGRTVGAAFLVLGAIAYWRGSHRTAAVFAVLGGVLLLLALAAPESLLPVERVWMAAGHAISRVTTPIVMGVLYFGLFTVFGGLRRIFGKSRLNRSPSSGGGYWVERPAADRRGDLQRQF